LGALGGGVTGGILGHQNEIENAITPEHKATAQSIIQNMKMRDQQAQNPLKEKLGMEKQGLVDLGLIIGMGTMAGLGGAYGRNKALENAGLDKDPSTMPRRIGRGALTGALGIAGGISGGVGGRALGSLLPGRFKGIGKAVGGLGGLLGGSLLGGTAGGYVGTQSPADLQALARVKTQQLNQPRK
jgi:hypothetical protein